MTNAASKRALILAACFALSGSAWATTYDDTTVTDHYGDNGNDQAIDIAGVVITNDATNITFQINMNPNADIGNNRFGNYEFGIQTGNGAGGQTAINGSGGSGATFGLGDPTVGTPYGNAVGISTGMNFFIGSFLGDRATNNTFDGGAQVYQYSSTTGWATVGAQATATEVFTGAPSSTFSFPLSSFGLTAGNSFKFDLWTTFGSPQSAYDALDNPNLPPGTAPFSGGTYDSATAAGSTLSVYTVTAASLPGSLWTGTNSGNWSDGGNWIGGVPNATDAGANFGTITSGNYTVALNGTGMTAGTVTFNGTTSYTIGTVGGNALTMQASGGLAAITVLAGNHTIAAPVTMMSDIKVTVAPTSTLSVTSALIAPTAGRTLQETGGGTLQFTRVQVGTLDANGGTIKFTAKGSANSASGTSVVTNVFAEAGGTIDLTNNALIASNTAGGGTATADIIRQMIQNGRLTTSLNTGGHALGYADNTILGRTTFGGITGVSSSTILVGYTFAGDANLDGKVNLLDLNAVATNFGATTGKLWTDGDVTYDGAVNISDFNALALNFGQSMASPAQALGTLVPEPTIGLAGFFSLLAMGRRRRMI
ncbi:MAG TPA: hypothetical protein VHS31_19015 [Tepidisphaeraceae bacterium]|jgi:hypothetical protein|nr:hypothetical protein [Tepidisphaeraceae bacterium]